MKTRFIFIQCTLLILSVILFNACDQDVWLKELAADGYPRVSPDGKWIVYYFGVVNGDPNKYPASGLYIMDIEGRQKQLLYEGIGGFSPHWSPDGQQIVTMKGIITLKHNVMVDFRPVSDTTLIFPMWSPDGKTILFSHKLDFYLCDTLFQNKRKLPLKGSYPRWMPDGKRIIYIGYENGTICISDTLRGNTVTFANDGGEYPTCSPDGSKIAWGKYDELYVMNSDGTEPRFFDKGYQPAWTPDSKYLVYSKSDNKEWKSLFIWKTSIDGKERVQLTKH